MTSEERARRIRELREAARDHRERMTERRAKAVAEVRDALLGPGAADLPIALSGKPDPHPNQDCGVVSGLELPRSIC